MSERTVNVARHFKECDGILQSELIKRFTKELEGKLVFYRDMCKNIEGPKLYRNQGKWEVLGTILGNRDKGINSLLEKIREDLKQETGSTE